MDKDLDITNLEFDQLDLVACYTGNNSTNKGMSSVSRPKYKCSITIRRQHT